MPGKNSFLGPPITGNYEPAAWTAWLALRRRQPSFHLGIVEEMMTDARVQFGLWLLKGPLLSRARFFIDCDNPEVKDFLADNITRYWRTAAIQAFQSLEWGFSCSEVLYYVREGRIHFDKLKSLQPLSCRAGAHRGALVYARIKMKSSEDNATLESIYLYKPRVLWTVHSRNYHRWYGRSRLYAAYLPWIEKWDEGGFRDSRSLFMHKYAFEGGTLYYPVGSDEIMQGTGNVATRKNYKHEAQEVLDKKRTGGTLALPNVTNPTTGNKQWEYLPPTVTPPPSHIMEHGRDLNDEILEAIGIPPEIARAEGTGAYAGRRVPEDAFYAILQEEVNWNINDANEQIFEPLVQANFGTGIQYEIVPFGLLRPGQQQAEQEQSDDQKMPVVEPPGASTNQNPVSQEPPNGYRVRYAG